MEFPTILCEDMLTEILCRLPHKDLIRYQGVSKTWYRLIADVCLLSISLKTSLSGLYFPITQSNFRGRGRGIPVTTRSGLRDSFVDELFYSRDKWFTNYVSLEEDSSDSESNDRGKFDGMSFSDLLPFQHSHKQFLESCNGLLLFVNESTCQYYVCNPLTKQCVAIPKARVHRMDNETTLAFDPAESSHYKVVHFTVASCGPISLDIFSSETGEWIQHMVQLNYSWTHSFKHFAYLNGILYGLSIGFQLLRFDLNVVNVCAIELPMFERKGESGCIGLSMGHLNYAQHSNFVLRIWFLEDCCESREWILKYSVCGHDLRTGVREFRSSTIWLEPYGFNPNSDVIFITTPRMILSYDPKHNKLKSVYKTSRGLKIPGFFYPPFICCHCQVPLKQFCEQNVRSTPLAPIS